MKPLILLLTASLIAFTHIVHAQETNELVKTSEYNLSATAATEGKSSAGITASIEENTVTVNYSINPHDNFTITPSISGTATDGLINIVSGLKYKKTLSAGLLFKYDFKKPVEKRKAPSPRTRNFTNMSINSMAEPTIREDFGASFNTIKYLWLAGSAKINHTTYPVYDPSASPDDLYTTKLEDWYLKASVSGNMIWVYKEMNMWLSPTAKFNSKRDFNEDDLVTVVRPTRFMDGTDTLTEIKETEFYKTVADRLNAITLELPYVIYFPKHQFGIDIAVETQVFPKVDRVAGRLGFYVPLATGNDEDPILTIEPLLRFSKLNETGLNFLKDQLSFGFNISVTLPKELTGS